MGVQSCWGCKRGSSTKHTKQASRFSRGGHSHSRDNLMNYAELVTAIEDTVENSFNADQVERFVQQAETLILNTVQIPALRKVDTGPLTINQRTYTLPADFLYTYSLAIVNNGQTSFLLNKDVNFLSEAYPTVSGTGVPKHYAYYSETQLAFGPTPNAAFVLEHSYGHYPPSIAGSDKTATTTSWLGDNFSPALFNGSLVEAAKFLQEDPDVVASYEKAFVQAMQLLKNLTDGRLRQDAYRSGLYRQEAG